MGFYFFEQNWKNILIKSFLFQVASDGPVLGVVSVVLRYRHGHHGVSRAVFYPLPRCVDIMECIIMTNRNVI